MPYDAGSEPTGDNVWPCDLDLGDVETWGKLNQGLRRVVGGVMVPANKLIILAPYLASVGLVGAVTVAVAIRRRKP